MKTNEQQTMAGLLDGPTGSELGEASESGQMIGQESGLAGYQQSMQPPEQVDSNRRVHQVKSSLSAGFTAESSSKSGGEASTESNGPEKTPSYPHTYDPQCLPRLGYHPKDKGWDRSGYESSTGPTQEEESGTSS